MKGIFAALSLLSALAFVQVPEFLQQYRQRLGGAIDELTIVVRNFDADARRSGYDRSAALLIMRKNSERFVREQGQRMDEYATRLHRLIQQQAILAKGVTLDGVLAVAWDYDQPILSKTWSEYAMALPLTLTSAFFAIVGWLASYCALLFLALLAGWRPQFAR